MRSNGPISRLFLVGCPRSGTTLLQSMMAAHSAVTSFPESHFFNHIAPRNILHSCLDRVPSSAHKPTRDFFDNIGRRVDTPDQSDTSFWVSWWARHLDAVAEQRGAKGWLEKTPSHLERIERIQKHIPEARFIHLVRNGVDTVASLYAVTHDHPDVWGGPRDIDTCVDRWIRSVRLTSKWCFKPDHFVAHYSTLVERPSTTLELLCDFLGLTFEPAMLDDFQSAASSVIESEEAWKSSNRGPLENKNRTKFMERFNEEERRHIVDRLQSADLPWPIA